MRLFIDGEWNSYGGELISMALVSESGHEWYEEFDMDCTIDPWVLANVIPKLTKRAIPYATAQQSLENFLMRFDAVHIVADWPEDIARFCDLLITGPGERIDTPPLTLEVLRVDSVSVNPHNALDDAKGFMTQVLANESAE